MVDFNKLLAATKAQQVAAPPPPTSVQLAPATVPPAPQLPTVVDKVPSASDGTNSASEVGPGSVVEYPGLPDLREKISSLDEALKLKHPAMDSLLQTIHRNLQKDPELIHLLKPEETAIIFTGLQQKTQTKIVDETVKSASAGRNKGLKQIGMEDL